MSGPLNLHSGGDVVTREVLRTIPVPPATDTWKPIAHFDFVQALDRQLAVRDIRITKEEFALAHDGLRLFGILELVVPSTNGCSGQDYAFAMGMRTANDRSFATQLAVGARVFVCANLSFSGDLIAMNRKHTAKFDLNADLSPAVDRFQTHLTTFGDKFDRLRTFNLSDTDARSLICLAFYEEILPVRLLHTVTKTYFEPGPEMADVQPRTAWGLMNAMTRAVKQLSAASAFRATTQLGRLFELTE